MAYLMEAKRKNPETGKIATYYRIMHSVCGKRTSYALGYISQAEARRLLTVFEGRAADGAALQRFTAPSSALTVEAVLNRLAEALEVRGGAENTREQLKHCKNAMLRHLPPYLAQLAPVGAVTPPLESYVLARRGEGVRNRTIQIELAYLRQAIELVGERPPPIPSLSNDDSRVTAWLTPAQREAFAAALPWTTEPASALAVYALLILGARKSEILSLRWESVLWHLGPHGAFFFGAVEVARRTRGHTKSRKERVVPLPERLAAPFRAEHKRQGAPTSGWVFPSEEGPTHLKNVRRTIAGACKRAGLPRISAHGLRHSLATAAAAKGVAKVVTQSIGGWKDPETLERIYTHLIDDATYAAIELLSVPQSTQPEHSAPGKSAGASTAANDSGGGTLTKKNRGGGI